MNFGRRFEGFLELKKVNWSLGPDQNFGCDPGYSPGDKGLYCVINTDKLYKLWTISNGKVILDLPNARKISQMSGINGPLYPMCADGWTQKGTHCMAESTKTVTDIPLK